MKLVPIFCCIVVLVGQNRLLQAVEYVHLGRNVTYECTASGGQLTMWRGSALGNQCVITLRHSHFGTNDAFGSCNNGTAVGQGIRREESSYVSQLTIFISPGLNGKTIECYRINPGHGETEIYSTTLHLFSSALKPPVLKCKPHYLNSTRALMRLETTFDKIQPFISSIGVNISVSSYTITYSASNSEKICESATILASSCDPYSICKHMFEVSKSSCPPTTDINVTIFADSTNGRGKSSHPLKRESINTFVNTRYNQEDRTITCLFQSQPLYSIKECAVICSGHKPRRRVKSGTNFVSIDAPLITSCFNVEAWSRGYTTVSVIIDREYSARFTERKTTDMAIIIGSTCGVVVLVVILSPTVISILLACVLKKRQHAKSEVKSEVKFDGIVINVNTNLGSGKGGCVFKGTISNTSSGYIFKRTIQSTPCAVKVTLKINATVMWKDWMSTLHDDNRKDKELSFQNECCILLSLHHQNIVKLFAFHVYYQYLVMELLEFDLHEYISTRRRSKNLSEIEQISLSCDIARALAHIHENNIVHGDLHRRNILIAVQPPNKSDLPVAKIADFGKACSTIDVNCDKRLSMENDDIKNFGT